MVLLVEFIVAVEQDYKMKNCKCNIIQDIKSRVTQFGGAENNTMNSLKELIIAQKEITELKAQIEKMKCCGNCKHRYLDVTGCFMCGSQGCLDCSKWEMKE